MASGPPSNDGHSVQSRVKRKPPPAFPYSSKWPVPDPNDPFAPLAVLRERAHSSNTPLVTPPDDPYSPNQVVHIAGQTHYLLTPDVHPPDAMHYISPRSKHAENHSKSPSKPWQFLTSSHHSDSSKPARPPRSKTRPGRDSYFADPETTVDARQDQHHQNLHQQQQRQHQQYQQQQQQPQRQTVLPAGSAPRLREQPASAQPRDTVYQNRRRSQSVGVLPSNVATAINVNSAPNASTPPRADPSRQYTYDDRQSHGYTYEYLLDMELREKEKQRLQAAQNQAPPYQAIPKEQATPEKQLPVTKTSIESRRSSRSSNDESSSPPSSRSRHPTPPMTPDDTLSTRSTSPPADRSTHTRSGSISPPHIARHDSKPMLAPSKPQNTMPRRSPEKKPVVAAVGDTPASIHTVDYSLLQSPTPPSSLAHAPPSSINQQTANHSTSRQVESEPETSSTVVDPRRVRERTSSLTELRRRLGAKTPFSSTKPSTGIRGKPISNPSPVVPGRKASFASDTSTSVAHGNEGRSKLAPPTSRPAAQASQAVSGSDLLKVPGGGPKPKKSLSAVNLKLKPLPNVSIGTPVSAHHEEMNGLGALGLKLPNPLGYLDDSRDPTPAQPAAHQPHSHSAPEPPASATQIPQRVFNKITQHAVAYPPPTPPKLSRPVVAHPASHPPMTRQVQEESDVSDELTYTALLHLRELTTPAPTQFTLSGSSVHNGYWAPPPLPSPEREFPVHESTPQRVVSPTRIPAPARAETPPPPRSPSPPPTPPRAPSPVRHTPTKKSPSAKQPTSKKTAGSVSSRRSDDSPVSKTSQSQKRVEPVLGPSRELLVPARQEPVIQQVPPAHRRSESPVPKPTHQRPDSPPVRQPNAFRRSESPLRKPPAPASKPTESTPQRPGPAQRRSDSPNHKRKGDASPHRVSPAQKKSESPSHRIPATTQRPETSGKRSSPVQRRSESPVYRPPPPSEPRRSESPATKRTAGTRRRSDSSEQPPAMFSPSTMPIPRTESPESIYSSLKSPDFRYNAEAAETYTYGKHTMSPIPSLPDPSLQESSYHSSSRARSPTPTKGTPASEVRKVPKKDNSRIEEQEAEEAEGYLPVAQVRSQPSSASKQTASSQATSSRKHSAQASSHLQGPRVRPQSPPPPPTYTTTSSSTALRARSPEPIVSPRQQTLPSEPDSPSVYSPTTPVRRQRTAPSPIAMGVSSPAPTTRSHAFGETQSEAHARALRHSPRPAGRPRRGSSRTPMVFSENALVGEDQLREAADLDVIAYNGVRVRFGELFRKQRTIVIFIRHFWCAMCQDYMYSIRKNVEPNALKRAGVSLVIIGNGSPGMVKSYRNIFRMPFDLYTDPTLRLHAALGMTLRSNDPGPDSERGSYVKHGLVGGIAMVVRNALRVGMPIWGKGGDATQLGGEFVFDPGMTCLFAHRMKNTRSHAPITDVLHAAGVRSSHYYTRRGINTARSMHHIEDEDQWMRERDRDLARMRNKKEMRRAGSRNANYCGPDADCDQVLYDTDASDSLGSWRLESVDDDMLQMEHDRDPDRGIESEPELMRSPAPPSKKRNVRSAAKTHPYVSNLDPDSPYAYANEKREVYRSENGRVKPKASSPPSRYTNGNGRQVQNDHTYAYTFGKA